jgi:hypothetical protein
MKIVVIGGTGLIGSKVVEKLKHKGHEAIAAAPNTGVNTITGEGLADALAGAQVVVDVANSPSFADQAAMDFFQTAGKNLAAAEAAAGIKHHVALSVVGTERLLDSGYFRAKLAQESSSRTRPLHTQSSVPPSSSSSSVASRRRPSKVTQCACRTRCSSRWRQKMSRLRSPRRPSPNR